MAGMADAVAMLEEDDLPDTWPSEDALKSHSVTFVDVNDDKILRSYKMAMSKHSRIYPMKHLIRGNVLIINNERFIKLEYRKGTEQDCNKIRAVFSQLGFNVIIYNNLTSSEMEETLLRESQNSYSNHDCFILFILSHGDRGVVLGTDANTESGSNSLSIKYIKGLFSQNKSLLGKPKLFFIQACQGSQCDKGHIIDDEPSTVGHLKPGRSPIKSEQSDSPYSEAVHSSFDEDEETIDGSKISVEADIFLSTATVEGYVSWRNEKYGTWYIQAICYVFRKYAHKHDLNDLMTSVNHLVSKAETKKGQFIQVPTKSDTLRKKLFFFPCLHEPYGTGTQMRKVVLVGRAGNGKSSVGNSILGQDYFKIKSIRQFGGHSENQVAANAEVKVVDCTGTCDTGSDMVGDVHSVIQSAREAVELCDPGFHALIFVLKYGVRFTKQEKDAVQMVKSIFGENVFRDWGILAFSYGDHFDLVAEDDGMTFEDWCQEQTGDIKTLFEEVAYRCVLFDNYFINKDKEAGSLKDKIQKLTKHGRPYTLADFDYVKSGRVKLHLNYPKGGLQAETHHLLIKTNQLIKKSRLHGKKFQKLLGDFLQLAEKRITLDEDTGVLKPLLQHVNEAIATLEAKMKQLESSEEGINLYEVILQHLFLADINEYTFSCGQGHR